MPVGNGKIYKIYKIYKFKNETYAYLKLQTIL